MKLTGFPEEYLIYGVLFRLNNRLQRAGAGILTDITMKQHFFMLVLGMFDDPPTLSEMASYTGTSYQNVKSIAQKLEKNNYLTIIQDTDDRRKLRLIAGDKFEALAVKNREHTLQFMKNLYSGLTRDDLATTLKTLILMDKNLGGMLE